jgi:glycosyltransferase involved in cell wall biosynthesis
LAAVYRHCAVLLLPSEREGFGLPVLEALACGTPVIASDIDAVREVGGTAIECCPPDDVACWIAAAVEAIEERTHQPARWAERKMEGLARAAVFSWTRYAAQVQPLYARLASGTSR